MGLFNRCRHFNLRCVHGDEINNRNGARTACLDCGKSLRKIPLLYFCYYTGELHSSWKESSKYVLEPQVDDEN